VVNVKATGADNVISSTAIDGSAPVGSLFCHLKPILTFGLLFADAGKAMLNGDHAPCGKQEALVMAIVPKLFQTAPSKYKASAKSTAATPLVKYFIDKVIVLNPVQLITGDSALLFVFAPGPAR
jgi:hypothetical protein